VITITYRKRISSKHQEDVLYPLSTVLDMIGFATPAEWSFQQLWAVSV
jgi:hypothetical protein